MANLDVSEVLEDALFTSAITLIPMSQDFDEYGNPVWKDGESKTIQAVVTSDLKSMLRLPEELRVEGSILVRFPSDLIPPGWTGENFDCIIWNGKRYTVKDTADYSQFGRGFYRCLCHPFEVV